MKKHIPNLVTCLNLFSGCLGIIFAFEGKIEAVAICVLLSGIFDLLDGLVARLLGVSSPMGKELDSLADVISFGFLPGMIYYFLLKESGTFLAEFPYIAFLIPIFSAIRLAKFNLDERQTEDFIGLNTPMNTFYTVSLPFIALSVPQIIYNPYFIMGSILLTSWLLVSEIRLFSMKFKDFSWENNKFRFSFLFISLILFIFLTFSAIPIILTLYILFSYGHFRKMIKI